MGWITKNAANLKNWKVDRKAEIMDIFNTEDYAVIGISGVGSTYYMAVQERSTDKVFAVVVLTKVSNENHLNPQFGYKIMDEYQGPVQAKCPKSILKLLPPTDNEFAKNWRQKCWNYANALKLGDLPEGSIIRVEWSDDDIKEYKKKKYRRRYRWFNVNNPDRYITSQRLNSVGWKLLKKGNGAVNA